MPRVITATTATTTITQSLLTTERCPPQVANLESFDADRTISLVPCEGEFALMNYRTVHGIRPPFRLVCSVDPDPASSLKAILVVRLRCGGQARGPRGPGGQAASGASAPARVPAHIAHHTCAPQV